MRNFTLLIILIPFVLQGQNATFPGSHTTLNSVTNQQVSDTLFYDGFGTV